MRVRKAGPISDHLYLIGDENISNYLLLGNRKAFLFDAGLTLSGPLIESHIRKFAGPSVQLHGIWLSHSHYDHIGAVPYLKKKFPGAKIYGHGRITKVLSNPRAIQLIQRLNAEIEQLFGSRFPQSEEAFFEPFAVDVPLEDGSVHQLDGGIQVQAYWTPGHTRDSMAFYILPDRALFGGDGLGIPFGETIQVNFLSNYREYLASLRRLQELDVEILCFPHGGALIGREEVKQHFAASIQATLEFREQIVEELQRTGGDVDQAARQIMEKEYQPRLTPQPPQAFYINLRAMVDAVRKDLEEEVDTGPS